MAALIAGRIRLLRLLGSAGAGLVTPLVVLQLIRAVVPAAQAIAVGALVAALSGTGTGIAVTAGLVAGLFLADQAVWLALTAVRAHAVRRIDGGLRAGLRDIAVALPTLDRLEDPDFQDRAARVVDAGMGISRERSAGNAAAGQLELMFRMLGALTAAALLATFTPVLAAGLLAVALTVRGVLRRQWLRVIDILDADTAGQRREYYVSEQAVVGAAKDVRLFGLADWFAGRFRAVATHTYAPVYREMLAVLRRQWWIAAAAAGAGAAALGVPAAAVLAGRLEPALLITYVLAGLGVLAISSMGMEAYDIEYGLRGVEAADRLRAEHRAHAVPRTAGPPAPDPPATAPVIRFENVVFAYPGAQRPVLDGLDLTLRPAGTVAVVGANGAGKTTFVKLLAGLYRPRSGRITVDGADLAELDPARWRERIAVLFQSFVRYPASLRDNVTTARPAADDEVVLDALRRAGGAPLLSGLAHGLDTSVWAEGTGGTDLSGGQWQRVALARALYAVATGRRVLVLDEPTAHLDVRAESDFHERVVARVHDATTILVSHRLSTVRPAGRIVLLRDGRVAEDGTHEELIALGGDYHRFFTVQAAAFAGEPTRDPA